MSTHSARVVHRIVTAVAQAVAALGSHPLRTGLGALATGVAVATIVVVVAALDGVALYARRTSARAFGADTFLIAQVASPGRVSRRELREQYQRNPPIKRSEARFLERQAGGLVLYAPNAQTTAEAANGPRVYENAAVTGTSAALPDIRDLGIARGRFFTDGEADAGAQVAVIGADVAEALFPTADPLDEGIRIAGRRFVVIGVQDRLGTAGGASQDRYVFIPLVAYERLFGAPRSLQIFGTTAGGRPSVVGEDRARVSLRARRSLGPGSPDTFDLLTPEAARGFVQRLSERIGRAAAPISLMALLAAMVVVTNTILVSVTERIREIGVRRALGASRQQIIEQVLAEAVLTAIAGGAGGILAAVSMVAVLARVADLPVAVRWPTIVAGLGAAALAGVAAGWFPARRATRLDVVAALRTE
jgi:putative ABC transport system permease protein